MKKKVEPLGREEIKTLIAAAMKADPEWARELHSSYVTRYLADNDRTWSSATWLVALAWTLFPAAITFSETLSPGVVVVFGATSVALVLLWLGIASAHRKWASRSLDLMRAIELNVFSNGDAIREGLRAGHRTPWILGSDPMGSIRWMILIVTVLAWGGLYVGADVGWIF